MLHFTFQCVIHLYSMVIKSFFRIAFIMIISILFQQQAQAQKLGDLLKKTKDSTGNKVTGLLDGIVSGNTKLSAAEVAEGLKEALEKGTGNSVAKLNVVDGYLANAAIKILMPPEAQKIEKTLRSIGLGKQVDQAITAMNRAAEDAAGKATPIFVSAIKQMTIEDAFGILRGGDSSATTYLRLKTTDSLTNAFAPVVNQSLEKVDATKYWNTIFTRYNAITGSNIETNLGAYVTAKALSGIFYQLAAEEKNIRQNPAARTSELLKKVFGTKQ